jgi:phosphatidylinositol glycan class B
MAEHCESRLTALGETLADTTRPAQSANRLLVACGLLLIVALAVGLRLVPILFVPSMNWGDEVFQTVEPAHRLVYGYGLMTWEFQLGMRSWLLPGAIAGLIELARLIGEGPQYYLATIAAVFGLVAAVPVLCAFLWCRRWFGLAAGFAAAAAIAVAPELVYFGARALNEVVAAHLLVIALYLIEPGYPVGDRRRLFAAGLMLGLVSLLRLQLAPAAALVILWSGLRDWRGRMPALIGGGGVAAAAIGAIVDWATLGYPFASVWRNVFYNIHLGVSSGFSVEPWFYYLLGELGVWLAAAPFVLVLVGIGSRRMPLLLAVALTIVAVHMAVPHKEYRFI